MSFTFKFPPEVLKKLKAIKHDIQAEQRQLSEAVGVDLLSKSQQAYLIKSRGGTGSDGIKWKPLAASTVAKRNRRGKQNTKRNTTKSGKARPMGGSVDIGRDDGFQLSSAKPGYQAPSSKKKHGGNIFRLTNTSITVGYGMSYSKYFDEDRAMLPTVLPQKWRESCEAIAARWLENIFSQLTD